MDEDFNKWYSIVGALDEDLKDKVFVLWSDCFLELDIAFNNFISNFELTSPEWCFTMDKFEQKNAQGPDVNLVVMRLICNHLWSHVFQSPTKRVPLFLFHSRRVWIIGGFYTPPKVADLKHIVLRDK